MGSLAINRRWLLGGFSFGILALFLLGSFGCRGSKNDKKPNFIIIFCDDVGYADFSSYGHPTINTPNIDRLAYEGQRWTNFYVPSSVCTPSRAGLLTGRLPVRSGMAGTKRRVIMPWSVGGLPQSEVTIAKSLKSVGYKTAAIGKWHVGHAKKEFLPNKHGFDYYYGIALNIDHYGTDGWHWKKYETLKEEYFKKKYYDVPLMINEEIAEQPFDPTNVTKRYVEESIKFIKENKEDPFFVYLSHSMAHVPLFTSEEFKNISKRGLYGDVMEEIDWGVGEIIKTLKEENLDEQTLVVFTSDNGPWLLFEQYGGSAGMLKGGKADLWEGGFRVPGIFWWPGKIKPGTIRGLGNTMDLYPTFCNLAGAELPDKKLDGINLAPALFEGKESPNDVIYYYRFSTLYAVRKGAYKAYFRTYNGEKWRNEQKYIEDLDEPLLFNLDHDPSENYNIAKENADVIAEIRKVFDAHLKTIEPVENQIDEIDEDVLGPRRKYYE